MIIKVVWWLKRSTQTPICKSLRSGQVRKDGIIIYQQKNGAMKLMNQRPPPSFCRTLKIGRRGKMSKYYFRDDDGYGDVNCYQKSAIIEQMKDEELTELTVYKAKRETSLGYFFCQEWREVWEVGESCGKQCDKYIPNNGKNGRCKHYRWCYIPTKRTQTFKVKGEQK
jgi:hypothetical protein